jgi:hypothetical protein
MGTQPGAGDGQDGPLNYFNYFTEIEEHFRMTRGTGLFLLSPLDWALIESWKNAEVPLEAVLSGIDMAFEKWRGRRHKTQMVNSLAFCAQAVLTEARGMAGPVVRRATREAPPAPFPLDDLRAYLTRNAAAVRQAGVAFAEVAAGLERLVIEAEANYGDLEGLELRLTVLEEKMIALARGMQSEEQSLEARQNLDAQLRPYRSKMTAGHLALLEKQYLERHLLDKAGLPRLSLFYMR